MVYANIRLCAFKGLHRPGLAFHRFLFFSALLVISALTPSQLS